MAQGWESPDGSRSVVFARGVVSAIRARALEGFHSLPKRGAEVGGLLVGRILRTKPLLARVTGFEEISCSHSFGPSFILSEEDKAGLEAALQRERPDPVIGFARSYTGRDMLLDEADRNLFERYFEKNRSLFLLLQPRAATNCGATFLFPENGEVGWEPQYPQFDFSEARLAGDGVAAAPAPVPRPAPSPAPEISFTSAPEPAAVAVETPVGPVAVAEAVTDPPPAIPSFAREPAHREPALREPAFMEPEPPRKRGFLLPLLGWIALCLAAAGIYELWTMARVPRWAPLGLTAQMGPGAIHLVWNQDSSPARDAVRGVLTVDDNGSQQRVSLTGAQVHAAAYDYRPTSSDVLFRLEFYGSGLQSAGDSLRVISSAPPVAAASKQEPLHAAPPAPDRSADRGTAEAKPANIAMLPQPLREIHPDIPAGIRARIPERIVVPVEVKVTASGKVTAAAAQGSGDGLYHYLAGRAKQAAMLWRFSPARAKNGKATPASRTVYFVFTSGEG